MHNLPRKVDLHIGDKDPDIWILKEYLADNSYLNHKSIGIQNENFDEDTQTALKKFQAHQKLSITGVLDSDTLNVIWRPRCNLRTEAKAMSWSFKWKTTDISYFVSDYPTDLPYAEDAANFAFQTWSGLIPLNISSADSESSANIRVYFNEIPNRQDVATMGMTYRPEPNIGTFAQIYLQYPKMAGEPPWTPNSDSPNRAGTNLYAIWLHEAGHALGLAHSNTTESVMYAFVDNSDISLYADDIEGITGIYGFRNK